MTQEKLMALFILTAAMWLFIGVSLIAAFPNYNETMIMAITFVAWGSMNLVIVWITQKRISK